MSQKPTATTFEKETADNSTAIKLIQKDISYMSTGIEDIKKSVVNLTESMTDGFVKKEDFNSLKTEVFDLKNLKDWALKIIIGTVIIALLSLVIINTGRS